MTATATRCRQGLHELTDENTKRGGGCRTCAAARARRSANVRAGRHPREVLLRVANAPLREHYLELYVAGQVTASGVAENAGWMRMGRDGPKGDSARLRRALGLLESVSKQGERYMVEEIDYDTAVLLCHAMHADPPAVGI